MAVERIYTVAVSALAHSNVLLPDEQAIRGTVCDALGKEYPNTSLRVSVQSKDIEYGGGSK